MAACVAMDTPLVGTSFFDGCGSLLTAFQETFGAAGCVEILNDPEGQDTLKAAGVNRYLTLLKSMVVDGVHCFGPPCCSGRTFLAKSKSMRSPGNVLASTLGLPCTIASRMAITACTACGVWFMVENPKGSLIFEHPDMRAALQTVGARKVMISLRSSEGCAEVRRGADRHPGVLGSFPRHARRYWQCVQPCIVRRCGQPSIVRQPQICFCALMCNCCVLSLQFWLVVGL